MPIGAALGAAAVGAGATVYASSKASSAAKKATAAETAAADSSIALQQQQYDQTRADLAPYRQVGYGALAQLAQTYGIPTAAPAPAAPQNAPVSQYGMGGYGTQPASALDQRFNIAGREGYYNQPDAYAAGGNFDEYVNQQFGALAEQPQTAAATTAAPAAPGTPANAPTGSDPRYGAFFASPDYQFRLDEGARAITGNKAARGLMDSGALGKGLMSYNSSSASQEYGQWFNRLASLAGIGQTATNSGIAAGVANANAQTGIIQNQGQNLSSSYATQGGIQAGMINGLGNTAAGLIKNWPTSGGSTGYDYMSPAIAAGSTGASYNLGGMQGLY